MEEKRKYFRRFAYLIRVLWLAAAGHAFYILKYVEFLCREPVRAVERGMLLVHVESMTEHVLMSTVLLTALGAAAAYIRRNY